MFDFSLANCTLIIFRLFSSCPCFEDSIHAQPELVTLTVAKLSSIVHIAHSFMIPVIKMFLMYNCVSGVPWGSPVFLAVPGSDFLSSSAGFFDSCFSSSSPFSYFLLHCSHNISWQRWNVSHSHLFPSHFCIHLHNDPAFYT